MKTTRTRKQELVGTARLPLPEKTGGAHKRRNKVLPRKRKHKGQED